MLNMRFFFNSFIVFIFPFLTVFAQQKSTPQFVDGEILIQVKKPDLMAEILLSLSKKNELSVQVKKIVAPEWNIYLLEVPMGFEKEILASAHNHPFILAAQLNHVSHFRTIPNDVNYPTQWALSNTGQNNGLASIDIDAERAWDFSTGGVTAAGDTLVIAILDDGLNLFHEDLAENIWRNSAEIPNNNIDDDHNGFIDDYNGWNFDADTSFISSRNHGSAVAGIAGAKANNNKGIAGVNWQVKLMPLQVSNLTDANVASAYYYAHLMRKKYDQTQGAEGAFIVATNASFGIDLGNPDDFPLWCGIYDSLGKLGILSVAATTNQAIDVDQRGDMPTACKSDFLISVTQITRLGIFPTAGFGMTTIDIAAPGTDLFSTITGNAYLLVDGNSFAAPLVTGVVALMYAAACDSFIYQYKTQPEITALQLKKFILDASDPTPALKNKVLTEGRLNAYRSILELRSRYCTSCDLQVQSSKINPTCFGLSNGAIQIAAQGGTPPYQFDRKGRFNTPLMDSLPAAAYTIFVIDSEHCVQSVTVNLIDPAPFVAGIQPLYSADSLQIIELQAQVLSGGTPPFIYTWNDTTLFSNPIIQIHGSPGLYSLTIIDNSLCEAKASFNVPLFTTVKNHFEENAFEIFPNPVYTDLNIKSSKNISSPVLISISDLQGRKVMTDAHLPESTQKINFSDLPNGIYIVHVRGEKFNFYYKILKQE